MKSLGFISGVWFKEFLNNLQYLVHVYFILFLSLGGRGRNVYYIKHWNIIMCGEKNTKDDIRRNTNLSIILLEKYSTFKLSASLSS